MAQITIYIPDDLKRRMRRYPDVNFSRAAAAGLRRALTMAERQAGSGAEDESRAAEEESDGDLADPERG